MYDFAFSRPKTIAQAVSLLTQEGAQALGGGQTLIPTMKQRLAMPSVLVSLNDIDEIKGICRNQAGHICIGAATTHAQVARDLADQYPGLARLASQIGDPAVRNRGTIGGSLANNDPSACYPAAALASDALVVTDRRVLEASSYFKGLFETALDEGELITELRFRVPARAGYVKFAQPASRFALVGVFVALFDDGARVAVTGASQQGVFRWTAAEEALDRDFAASAIDALLPLDAEDMISDIHADAAYRAALVKIMTKRALSDLVG